MNTLFGLGDVSSTVSHSTIHEHIIRARSKAVWYVTVLFMNTLFGLGGVSITVCNNTIHEHINRARRRKQYGRQQHYS